MKRFILILTMLVMCMCLAGCSKKETLADELTDEAKIDDARGYSMGSGTRDAVYAYDKAKADYTEAANKTEADYKQNIFASFWSGITGKGFTAKQRMEKDKQSKLQAMNNSQTAAAAAVESDEAIADAKAQEEAEKNSPMGLLKRFWWVLIILVAVIIIIMLISKNKHANKSMQLMAASASSSSSGSGDVNVNKSKALCDWCAKANLDPNQVLQQCNGDVDKAVNMAMMAAAAKH